MTLLFQTFVAETKSKYNPVQHDTLNPTLWKQDVLNPKIQKALLKIATEFQEFLEMPGLDLVDVTITGSMANYNWTAKSDIDLHLIVNKDTIECSSIDPSEYFMTKKSIWNDNHNITIFGHPVELYVQGDSEPHTSTGVYSLLHSKWLKKPVHKDIAVDDGAVSMKAREIMVKIDHLIDSESNDITAIEKLKEKIRKLRQVGLERDGEFSIENLAFKVLRNNGYLEKLYTFSRIAKDKTLSVE